MTPAQRRPEITPGYDAPSGSEQPSLHLRSTKAGDYPRLRRGSPGSPATTSRAAQRRPEITPGYDASQVSRRSGPSAAQRRPEITPGYDRDSTVPPCRPLCIAQRRPEITPGYDAPRRPPNRPPDLAQRRPEITPGYDAAAVGRGGVRPARSTKAGDYPRLRRRRAGRRRRGVGTLNEGRRLPPATTLCSAYYGLVDLLAQRRPEITPGYDGRGARPSPLWSLSRSTKAGDYPRLRHQLTGSTLFHSLDPLNEGRRLPPATTHRDVGEDRHE